MTSILKFPSSASSGKSALAVPNATYDAVVLIHGLFASRRSMSKARSLLEEAGYLAINWTYPIFWKRIENFTKPLSEMLGRMERDPHIHRISFLTHSYGAIVMRYVLEKTSVTKGHRAVMLAPPNSGSKLTRIKLGPFRYICPSIDDISLAPESLANRLPSPTSFEFGIVAAESDFVVAQPQTHLEGQTDHCVVPTSHFAMPQNDEALSRSMTFLQTGRFSPHNLSKLAQKTASPRAA